MPTSRDLKNRGTASGLFGAAIASNTTTNSSGLDTSDAKSILLIAHAILYTDGNYALNVQESDDDSTYTDVEAVNIIGTEGTIDADNEVFSIGVHPQKKYVRLQIVSTSVTTGATLGVVALKQDS